MCVWSESKLWSISLQHGVSCGVLWTCRLKQDYCILALWGAGRWTVEPVNHDTGGGSAGGEIQLRFCLAGINPEPLSSNENPRCRTWRLEIIHGMTVFHDSCSFRNIQRDCALFTVPPNLNILPGEVKPSPCLRRWMPWNWCYNTLCKTESCL